MSARKDMMHVPQHPNFHLFKIGKDDIEVAKKLLQASNAPRHHKDDLIMALNPVHKLLGQTIPTDKKAQAQQSLDLLQDLQIVSRLREIDVENVTRDQILMIKQFKTKNKRFTPLTLKASTSLGVHICNWVNDLVKYQQVKSRRHSFVRELTNSPRRSNGPKVEGQPYRFSSQTKRGYKVNGAGHMHAQPQVRRIDLQPSMTKPIVPKEEEKDAEEIKDLDDLPFYILESIQKIIDRKVGERLEEEMKAFKDELKHHYEDQKVQNQLKINNHLVRPQDARAMMATNKLMQRPLTAKDPPVHPGYYPYHFGRPHYY